MSSYRFSVFSSSFTPAARCPPGWEVETVDENIEPIPLEPQAYLIEVCGMAAHRVAVLLRTSPGGPRLDRRTAAGVAPVARIHGSHHGGPARLVRKHVGAYTGDTCARDAAGIGIGRTAWAASVAASRAGRKLFSSLARCR